jgi:transcriptional regulator with XRE-family HTH domain
MKSKKIGEIIKDLRKKENLTQKELADILGVTYQAVSKWENNKNIPDIEIIKVICNKFNIDINDFLNIKKTKKRNQTIFIIISILTLTLLFLFAKNINPNFELICLNSANKDFEISGTLGTSNVKKSIVISNIKYLKEDNNYYTNVECSLYEIKDGLKIEVEKCKIKGEVSEGTLSDILLSTKFKIDEYVFKTKKDFLENLYVELNAYDNTNSITTFKINLVLEDTCPNC